MRTRSLDLPAPSPSTPFLVLRAHETGRGSSVEYEAWGDAGRVRLRFERLIAARMDAYGCEAATAPIAVGEILDSRWLAACAAQQARSHPESPDTLSGVRHFFVKGHDTTVEVLAAACVVEPAGRDQTG